VHFFIISPLSFRVENNPDQSRRLLKMQIRNIQDEENDGYSNIVDEMQVTIGCSSTVLIDAKGAG
jgi:hypothetical protein